MKLRQAKKILTRLHGPLWGRPVRWPVKMYSQYKQPTYAAAAIRWNRYLHGGDHAPQAQAPQES